MKIFNLCSIRNIFLGIIAALFIVSSPVLGAEETHKWVWTKDRPKPAWFKWDSEKSKPVRGGYIRFASNRYIGLMNPNHWPVYDWVAMTQMYEDIAYVEGDWLPSFPWLAESYHYPNPTTNIMKLRKGIKFHDGTDFNAQAVKYLIEYIQDKKNGCWSRAWIEPVKSVEVIDDHTVKWNFKRPWAGFMGMMATVPGYMISQKALEGDVALIESVKLKTKLKNAKKVVARETKKLEKAKGGSKLKKAQSKVKKARKKLAKAEKLYAAAAAKAVGAKSVDKFPVGTGRYMFEEGRPGNYLKLKRNPNWWFAKSIGQPDMPYPDGLIYTVISDLTVRLANLRAGKIHMLGLSPTQVLMLKRDRNFKVTSQTGNHLVALRFNTQAGPAKDLRIRKAVSHAINREALLAGVQFGQGTIASAMYMGEHWAHNPNIKPVKFDPELSKRLLAEAGYPNGLTIKGYMSNIPDFVTLTAAIKSMLAKVNIKWEVDSLDNVAISDRMKNVEYDLAAGGWAYIKDPDMMATGLFHPDGGFNYGRSNNPEAIKLILAGNTELDQKKRQQIYWKLEEIIYNNYEDVWLWNPIITTARSKKLMGYDVNVHNLGREGYWFSHPEWLKDGKE